MEYKHDTPNALFLVTVAKSVPGDNFRLRLFTVQSVQRRSERGVKCGPFEIRQETDRSQRLVQVEVIVLRKLIPRSTCFFNELWGREVWCGCCRFGIAKVDVISQAYQSLCQPPRYRGALLALVIISAQLFVLTALAQETIRYD